MTVHAPASHVVLNSEFLVISTHSWSQYSMFSRASDSTELAQASSDIVRMSVHPKYVVFTTATAKSIAFTRECRYAPP